MDKHELLQTIYKQYNIEDLVKRNIQQSIADESYKDLAQQIYLILYDLPYSRLYYLLSRKQIPHYITGIIKNQRQSKYLDYLKYFKIFEKPSITDIAEQEYKEDKNILRERLETIDYVLHKKYPLSELQNFSYIQKAEFFSIEIYKLYLKKKATSRFTFTKLTEELKISRDVVNKAIQEAKKIIRDEHRIRYKD